MKVFLLFVFALLVPKFGFSQSIANYTTARTAGNTYTSIASTGTAFDSWRNTGTFSQDDNRSDLTDIGFDFWYNGIRYTQFSVSTNGFLDFSTSVDDGTGTGDYGYSNAAFTANGSGTWLSIAPFYDDLTAQGGEAALGNSIKYQLSGTAPNRILTIEWINMAVYGNTAPSLNFQVKLSETTGVIEMNYGTMNNGGVTFSYTTGINGPTLNNTPTAAQLKTLQTENTNTLSNVEDNALSVMPASGSRYTFTPPTPGAPTGSLTFTAITQTGMTLNWTNWATNEVGYVIYNSTDNVNFTFVAQTAANAINRAVAGLTPGTTYYWRLYTVTEGRLSAFLSGTQATLAAGNKVSNATGSWNTPGIWTPAGVPTATDNVTISNTHTVTINVNAVCNNLTVGVSSPATLSIGNNTTIRTLAVGANITINTGSSLSVPVGSNATHAITINGNVVNNGTLNLASDANSLCTTTIQKNGNVTISGTGATTTFNTIAMNLGTSINNTLEVTTPTFVAPANFLTLTTGTFKLSTSGASTITPFTGTVTIPQKGGIWLNSASSTINFGTTVTMYGNITNSNGTMNIGNIADEDLVSNGGVLTASGGTTNIAGKYYATGINNLSKFNITGGTVIVPAISSSSTTIAPFQIAGAGSQFTMTAGSLIIPREGGSGAQNLGFVNTGATGGTVTGGTLQIGNASTPAAAQIIQINSTYPVANLLVNNASANASLQTSALSVISNVTITAGTLTSNSFDISLGGNWTNNGGTFAPGTGTVIFNGTGGQIINGTAASQTFNNVNVAKTAGTLLSAGGSTTTITTNNLTLTTGNFNAPATLNITGSATASLTHNSDTYIAGAATFVTGNWTRNGGTFVPGTGTVTFSGTAAQSINGTIASHNFNNVVIAKTAGTLLSAGGSVTTISTNSLTQTTGNFTAPATLNVTAATTSSILLTAGTFTSGANINLNGNWTNNGATFTPGTGTVTLTGTTAQTIFKTGGETFNNLVCTNAGTKTLNSPVTTNAGLTINSGSTFDVNTGNFLVTVKGNFTNSGTMVNRSGNVFMNGTTAQTISGTTLTNFYDLTLNNAAGASLLSDENIINSLVLNNGTFNVNGRNFTLISTATGSGRIAEITGTGDITGNVIVQRYAPGGYTGWAFLGAPITSALSYTAWDDDIPISCNSCPDGSAAGFESIYTYNEAVNGAYDNASAYVALVDINDPIVNGKGYWVYFGDGFTTTNNITLDVTGAVRKGNYTLPLSYTNFGSAVNDGWNLISNPYPSPIRWSLLKGTTTGIDNSVYVYNADLNGGTGSYATYINGISSPAKSAGGIGDTLPIGQGFYVHSTGATALSARETNKVGGNPTFLRQINPENSVNTVSNPLIRLFLDESSGTFHDETVLYTQSGANHTFDEEYDAYKLIGGDYLAPLISLEYNNDIYQVNGVAPIVSNFSMPLRTTTGYAGSYTISSEGVSAFAPGACISLYDNYTGITTDLTTSSYTFTLSDTTVFSRFLVTITIDPLQVNSSMSSPTCQAPTGGEIIASGDNSGPWNYFWTDNNGVAVQTSLNKTTADTLSGLSGGDYNLLITTVGMCDYNTTQYTVDAIDISVAQFSSSADTVYLSSGASVDFTNTSSNSIFSNWNFGDSTGISTSESPSYIYNAAGVYTVVLITESPDGCADSTSRTILVIDNVTGLSNQSFTKGLIIKTTGESQYQLQQKLDHAQTISFALVDALGKTIRNYGELTTDAISLSVDLAGQQSGIYYLRMASEEGAVVIKLLKS
ncbi:MAG: hypothetical protein K0S33_1647 [Bacteroidetes bacterium]|jgi:hypothetical protein|nr:hypothetical protein [Bacteroidota bacterium]